MLKILFKMISEQPDDTIAKRLDSEVIANKYWNNLGLTLILTMATILIGIVIIIKSNHKIPAPVAGYDAKKNTVVQLITLPYPHQSFKNISSWFYDAIRASYAFNFNKIDEQIAGAEYYFTSTGYSMYLKALESSKIREDVINKSLIIGVVPVQNPVLINSGVMGDTEFWRLRVPILTSYYAGKDPVVQKNMVEVLIIRVPAYKNPKGLAITEFNIAPI